MSTNQNNTVMDKLAVGAVFAFGHDRDKTAALWIKVSNELAKQFMGSCRYPYPNGPDAADLKVTYIGREDTLRQELGGP